MTCGFSGLAYTTPRHHCTCAPMHVEGMFLASTGTARISTPATLVDGHPRLAHARQGEPRFVPKSLNETLSGTFTLWNLLDATMHDAAPDNNYQTGYVRELQLRRMMELARTPELLHRGGTYCEIGFNGGHSSAAMLLANPKLVVHSFDLMMWAYSDRAAALLKLQFGTRFHIQKGNSLETVPQFTREHKEACDVLFVDGDHSEKGAKLDMQNMRFAAAPGPFHAMSNGEPQPCALQCC